MRVDKLRGEFSVYVVGDATSPDIAQASRRMIEAGYQPQFLEMGPQLLIRARQDPPHLVLFQFADVSVFETIRELLVLSHEIKCVIMASSHFAGQGALMLQGGAFDVIDRIEERWDELVPRLDRALEQWVIQIRSEETSQNLATANERIDTLSEQKNRVVPKLHPSILSYLEGRSKVQDGDELFGLLTQSMSSLFEGGQTLLFRYLPGFRQISLFSSNTSSARGVGLKLSPQARSRQGRIFFFFIRGFRISRTYLVGLALPRF